MGEYANSTDSIFGGDRAEILNALFSEESWNGFSNAAIKKNAVEAIETLRKNQADSHGWLTLTITIGNSPLYADLHENFVSLIGNLDFPALLEQDLETAIKALFFIINQITN